MITPRLASLLLLSTALATPTLAFAQNDPTPPAPTPSTTEGNTSETVSEPAPETTADSAAPEEETDVSIPGGEIVVTGARERNLSKSSDQVISVLSTAEIAKTGEGNIAGALGRVTGLSVVGNGYVYVRGLGDRYSLALLNGSPLPSPEPLKRVVPLDLFPSGVIASSLVQKSYSVNFPGEFGGGVINLTTRAVPNDPFLTFSFGVSGDTETTGHLGYTYYGSGSDWTGFDNGQRDLPPALQAFLASGERLSAQTYDSKALAASLVSGRSAAVQRWKHLPPNFSGSITGGKAFDIGDTRLGVIATLGYSNKWLTRESLQQTAGSQDLSQIDSSFRQINTDQRIVVNGMIGIGLEFGENKIRWTNLYIRDSIKQARLSLGTVGQVPAGVTPADVMRQRTAWYERQLIDTQLVGEFKLTPDISLDLRGGFANSQREAPFESAFEYVRTNNAADPFGAQFINVLNRARGDARVIFSDLNEDLWSAGADLTWRDPVPDVSVTVGGAWSNTHRTSSRREFFFDGHFPAGYSGVGLLRPDLLLAPGIVNPSTPAPFRITVLEADEGNPAFDARLKNWAGYAKINAQFTEALSLDIGVRYEKATQTVAPIQVFNTPGASTLGTDLDRGYWLPGGTLTYQINPKLQVRVSASKTIARPQFRELINQPYFDPDSNRSYRGNPLLIDSQLYNAEARVEWYFAPEQRVSISGFYKQIKKPIEAFIDGGGNTSFANAPEATLYGAELEVQKNFDLVDLFGDKSFLSSRRLAVNVNYTFTKSELSVAASDLTAVPGVTAPKATDYFRDGAPLTGQSDHIANLQIGLEHPDRLSQQTLMLTYASDRVISRGQFGTPPQPDVIERPGLRLDFVVREGVPIGKDREVELKFEARNITGRKHEEFQQSGANRIEINTYDVGTTLALSAALKF